MTEIYRAGWQLVKVRAIMILALPFAIAFIWWGWDIFTTYGTRPADGGVLAPFTTRLLFGGFVAAFGLACVAGMWFYGTLYAGSIRYDAATEMIHLRTVEYVFSGRDHPFPPSAITETDWHDGRSSFEGGVSVNAPWMSVRVAGRRFPYIIDAQGHFPDRDLGNRLFKGVLKAR